MMTTETLVDLLDTQRALDDVVLQKHNLTHDETIERRYLATIVELGEFAQEWRGFKYWSTNQEPTADLLDEFVDVLHFALSLTEYYRATLREQRIRVVPIVYMVNRINTIMSGSRGDVTREILHVTRRVAQSPFDNSAFVSTYYSDGNLLGDVLRIGVLVGYTLDDIIRAYYQKNSINHDRQKGDY